jgi:hypothetical protein
MNQKPRRGGLLARTVLFYYWHQDLGIIAPIPYDKAVGPRAALPNRRSGSEQALAPHRHPLQPLGGASYHFILFLANNSDSRF